MASKYYSSMKLCHTTNTTITRNIKGSLNITSWVWWWNEFSLG